MRSGTRSGLAVLTVVAWCLAVGPGAATAGPFAAQLQHRADAWRQIKPLLRERAGRKASGFDFEPTVRLKSRSGETVRVFAIGSSVAIAIGRGGHAVSVYLARGTATSRRLRASYGLFGRIDMRFHPSPAPEPRGARSCKGRHRHPALAGVWVGTLRFQSEGHQVGLDVHRAPGSIRREGLACFSPHRHRTATASSGPFSSFSLFDLVSAGWHQGLESAQVTGLESGQGTLYLAFTQRVVDSVAILDLAVAASKESGTLTVSSTLTHAEISPPAPFHGTGTYKAAADGSTTWTGDLTVNLPDAPRFPLAGEQFKAEVRRSL
jgi:hypothetical protein